MLMARIGATITNKHAIGATHRIEERWDMIVRNISILLLLFVWCGSAGVFASEPMTTHETQLKELERRVQAVYASVKPAVVRISRDEDRRQTYSGIIVREDGLVLTHTASARNVRAGDRITVHLDGGRRAKATALGWSNEWGIALVKITEQGPWPHAQLGQSAALRPGQPCVALGYPRAPGSRYDQEPALRLGCITKSAGSLWVASSCLLQPGDFGSGLFDLEGRLVGMTTQILGGNEGAVHTATEVVKAHWDDLAAGKNLDFVRCLASDKVAGKPSAATGTPSQPEADASHIAAATDRVKRATVKLQFPGEKGRGCGGVIVTSDGHIITCAHARQLPGQKIVVSLADGRDVAGMAQGTNWIADIAVVKITEKGPWPYVPMGHSTAMKPQDPCLLAGYPTRTGLALLWSGRQPDVRREKIADRPQNNFNASTWSCFLATDCQSGELEHGMSGGGVFDLQGCVVAVNQSTFPPNYGIHGRIELFKNQWDWLVAGKPFDVLQGEPLAEVAEGFRRAAKRLPPFGVEVLGDGKRIALGTIVRGDGMILTKASELQGLISCKLADNRTLVATIQKVAHEHDLAVLKVEATNLPVAEWSQSGVPPVGTVVSAIIPGKPQLVGVVSHAARSIPPEHGRLEVDLRDSPQGLETTEPAPGAISAPFRNGDVIVHIEGHPTPNRQAYRKLLEPPSGEAIALAGDRVRVGIKRGTATLEVRAVLISSDSPTWSNVSPRCAGFPSAFDADIPLASDLPMRPDLCGGPVIDGAGLVVGVAIACRPWPIVLPASIARKFLTD
jgi:S1-C subfamily serine protease